MQEILPELPSLVHNAFASHVLRALLSLLAPSNLAPDRAHKHVPTARSKKSASWKARIGHIKPVIQNELDLAHSIEAKRAELSTPGDFQKMACKILRQFKDVLGGNEVRALAMDKVACPVLQVSAMGILIRWIPTSRTATDAPGIGSVLGTSRYSRQYHGSCFSRFSF